MTGAIRAPAVAGQFYPADVAELDALLAGCLQDVPREGRRCRAAIVPHAGLVYSGRTAAAVFARLLIPPVVVILAPNHTGRLASPGASVWDHGSFLTPLGPVAVESAFAGQLVAGCDLARSDVLAHRLEHAVEVELPFLQRLAPGTSIVPIVLAWDDWERSRRLAQVLARLVLSWPAGVLLLASSDMTHYEPAGEAARKDRLALAAIERLDGAGLLETCRRHGITMCGRAPAATVLEAARELGATGAELVDYRHSGLVSGDDTSVVSYAGVLIP
jgi:MEMO1 family protein